MNMLKINKFQKESKFNMLSKEDLLHINRGYSGKDSSFAHDFGYILGVCGRFMKSIAECYARGAMSERDYPYARL